MNVHVAENPKEAFGNIKPCIQFVPMNVILQVAEVFKLGASKYGQKNWRVQPVAMSTYYSAMFRHMVAWFEDGVDADPESGMHHLAHAVACAMIILDGVDQGNLIDDRAFAEAKTSKIPATSQAGE